LGRTPILRAQNFENVQKVVAAFKGQASGAQSQVQQLSSDLAVANSEIENRKEQVGRLSDQLLEKDKIHKAELDALKSTFPDVVKMKAQYDSSLGAKQAEVDAAKREVGTLNKQIALLQNVPPNDKLINKIITFLKTLLSKKN
jgi:polyhydroxyalkanoate synthesis regulator phasin